MKDAMDACSIMAISLMLHQAVVGEDRRAPVLQ